MEIRLLTKEESKRMQQEEFLKLSPAELYYAFLDLSYRLKDFPQKNKEQAASKNFVIKIENE